MSMGKNYQISFKALKKFLHNIYSTVDSASTLQIANFRYLK